MQPLFFFKMICFCRDSFHFSSVREFWLNGLRPMCYFKIGRKKLPHPQNRILIPLSILFKISDKPPRPFCRGIPLSGSHYPTLLGNISDVFFSCRMCHLFLYCMKTALSSLGLISVCILCLVYRPHLIPCLQMCNCRPGAKCCCLVT